MDNSVISIANAQTLDVSIDANLLPTYPPKKLPTAKQPPKNQFTCPLNANKHNETKLKIRHNALFIALASIKSMPRCNNNDSKIKVAVSSTIIPPHKPNKQNKR